MHAPELAAPPHSLTRNTGAGQKRLALRKETLPPQLPLAQPARTKRFPPANLPYAVGAATAISIFKGQIVCGLMPQESCANKNTECLTRMQNND